MERTKQKSKKEKPDKYLGKEKSSSFISDIKAFKENLKFMEMLKTVKMNSSMRIKAPRGSKVMQNKDFNDNEDIFDDMVVSGGQQMDEPPSATNTVLNNENESEKNHEESTEEEEIVPTVIKNKTDNASSVFLKSKSLSEGIDDCNEDDVTPNTPEFPIPPAESAGAKFRDRKLSLDHTMLLRREGLSQSEVDLNFIGKSPLERKSSFFKKKMDSFVRNTTEIFKRQSMNSKSTMSPVTSRRDSTSSRMSVSLQSLNENSTFFEEFQNVPLNTYREQQSSVSSLATPRTDSTLSIHVNDRLLEQAEVDTTADSPLLEDQLADTSSTSSYSLNKEPIQDSLLNARAISMSSGLDTATGQRRRKNSRSNRVSWLASESLTDYFRRLIQDEKSKDVQGWQSYQDFSAIPENRVDSNIDSKGRRMSYMRAVSGEDPSLASSLRKKKLMETEVPARPPTALERTLTRFSLDGIPPPVDFVPRRLPDEAQMFLDASATHSSFLDLFPNNGDIETSDFFRQATLQELVVTEAQYIQHLKVIVDVYIATVHGLQKNGFLLDINAFMVFSHMPDVYNSAIKFWELVIYPMLHHAKENGCLLDPKLIIPGFLKFDKIFNIYEEYMLEQTTSMDYLRNMSLEPDFACYINWCNKRTNDRLQLQDILIKPMQRLTKYVLIIARINETVTDKETKRKLSLVEDMAKSFVSRVNRAVRQKEEMVKLGEMIIEPFEPEYKGDEEVDKKFKKYATINLHSPMIECGSVKRCLIHQGMVRYKDAVKETLRGRLYLRIKEENIYPFKLMRILSYLCSDEFDAHLLLFTDIILVTKKLPKVKGKEKDKEKYKKEYTHWRMVRPKIMLSRLLPVSKKNPLVYAILDELEDITSVFQLSESSKDSFGETLKDWEMKIFEAMVTYDLTKSYVKNSPVDLDKVVQQSFSNEENDKADVEAAGKRARERVAAMLHKKTDDDTDQEFNEKIEFYFRLLTEYSKYYSSRIDNFDTQIAAAYLSSIDTDADQDQRASQSETSQSTASVTAHRRRRSSMAAAMLRGMKGSTDKGARDTDIERRASQTEMKSIHSEGAGVEAAKRRSSPTASNKMKDPSRQDKGHPNLREIFETGISHKLESAQEPVSSRATSSVARSASSDTNLSSCWSYDETKTDSLHRSRSALERNRSALYLEDGWSPARKLLIPKIITQNQVLAGSVVTPTLVLEESSPNHSPGPLSSASPISCISIKSLRVASDVNLLNSLPNINREIRRVLSANLEPKPIQLTASERLYRSHQELMEKNRLASAQHYLKPDSRGSSYPPPSPRALKRGDALSFSFTNPPLTRAKNVPEQVSPSQPESTRRIFGRRSPQPDMATGAKSPRRQRSPSPIPRAVRSPAEKPEKKKSLFLRRSKDSQSPKNDECDAADDRSRRSSQEEGKYRAQRAESNISEDASTTTTDQDNEESVESRKKKKDKG